MSELDGMEIFGYYDPDYEKEFEAEMTPADMVKEYYNKAGITPDPHTCGALVREEHEEWEFEFFEDDQLELKELADKVYTEFGYAQSRGWDLMEALRRLHRNNMERMYQDDGTIKRRQDGKIVKNPNTPKVFLDDLV